MTQESSQVGQESKLDTVTVGHTPDMDDAFMFYGIAKGQIEMNGYRFEHIIEDIQALNERALKIDLDMTAISAASYPELSEHYWIAAVGSSVGRGYGPLIIAKEAAEPKDLKGKRIAVPGMQTTACLLLRLAIPGIIPVEMPFDKIPDAVLQQEVDAGLVIHEWQLIYRDAGLLPLLDLGIWWQQETHLPLPLGLNVIKASLGREKAIAIATIFRDSILYSFANQDKALEYSMEYGRGIDVARARQFVGMYVNEETLTLSKECQEALHILFERAHKAELINRVPDLTVIEPTKI